MPWVLLHLLMFMSGALALVYEILWMRRFAAVFGATTPAVAAVLASVFLGFTAGSLVMGARAMRFSNLVRVYGLLEIGIGLGALLVEPLLRLYENSYPELYRLLSGSPAGFFAMKTVLAMAALFVPTFCMGGTIPLLGQALAGSQRRLGISAGGLYAANTLGAAVGAFSVPFFWLPNLSAHASYGVCVAGNLLIGIVAWSLDTRTKVGIGDYQHTATSRAAESQQSRRLPGFPTFAANSLSLRSMTLLAALSGLLLFVLQVVWSRMFAQVHENSIYSFSVVVAVLLMGLAGGAVIARRLLRSGRHALNCLGWAWMAGGAIVFLTPNVFFRMTNGLSYLESSDGWTSYGFRLLGITLPTVLAPTLLAGMVLPLLLELAGRATGESSGRVLGWLIGTNTAGSIIGALLAAFFLPAWLGLWTSLVCAGVMMMAAGDFCLFQGQRVQWFRLAWPAIVVVAFGILKPAQLPRTKFRAHQGETLLALKESSHGIVAVVENGPSRRIKLNNFYVLGGTASTGDERMQAHLPLLLHPAPKRVAFLGLGTGITAGAALLHPVERITAIEIVPDVITTARAHFAEANLGIIDSPRADVISGDARNYLKGAGQRFDVVVGDLFVPWHQGESLLYTIDQFAAVRRALAPGGIFCQWLPMFQLSEEEFNIVTATFLDVFPRATLWRGDFAPGQPAVALIGHLETGALIDSAVVARRLREVKSDDANPTLAHPAGLWMFLAGPVDPAADRFARARRNRENEPWLEILGPLNHAGLSRGKASLFVGRRLEAFLQELREDPTTGTSLAGLDSAMLQWRSAGAKLAEASNLTMEGKHREAEVVLRQTISIFPSEIRGFFVPPPPPANAP